MFNLNTLIMTHLTRTKLLVAAALLLALPLKAQVDGNPQLINITTLDQLYAIRYDMNGDGTPDAATQDAEKIAYRAAFGLETGEDGSSTPTNNICTDDAGAAAPCEGYELMNNLDFDDTDPMTVGDQFSKWAKDCSGVDCVTGTQADGTTGNTGWEPIYYYYFNDQGTPGTSDDVRVSASFSSRFHGNELTISNLYVNRRSEGDIYGGLFGRVQGSSSQPATLDSLGLEDIEVTVESTSFISYAGGLVGYMESGSITASYATGNATSTNPTAGSSSSYAGGLVGSSSRRQYHSLLRHRGCNKFKWAGLLCRRTSADIPMI